MIYTIRIILVSILLTASLEAVSQHKPRRFNMPLDAEAELNKPHQVLAYERGSRYQSLLLNNVNISIDSFPQNEPSVKISRKDPSRVVAAWRDFRRGVSNPTNRQIGYSYSTNGGNTWSQPALLDSTLLPGFPRNSDPVVAVDSAGNFYIAVVCIGNSVGVGVYKSTDGGVTFPLAYLTANTGSEDKEWLETDRNPGSPHINNIYMSWTRFSGNTGIKLARSTNGGVNWSDAISVSDQTGGVQGSDLAVGPAGEVYVTWLDVNSPDDVIKFDKSTNGGLSFGTDFNITAGATPQIPISSSNITFPSIAADAGFGSGRGNIYVTWCDARNGDPDIFFSASTDMGATWSVPLRVNSDPVGNGKLQCWPWIEVNELGQIVILYYSSQNTTSNNVIEAYMAWSGNMGASFTNNLLSSQPSPTNQPNTAVRFGDYICTDFYGDRAVPVWTDERAGGVNMEIYTNVFFPPVSVASQEVSTPDGYYLGQNFPNPFNPSTKIRFAVPKKEFIKVTVHDVLGKEIAVIAEGFVNAGEHEATFSAEELASGTYICRMSAENYSASVILILSK